MPTASIQSWLPMRRTMTVSPGLEAAGRGHFEAARAHRHVLVGDELLGLVLRRHTGRAGDPDERRLAAAEAAAGPPPRPRRRRTAAATGPALPAAAERRRSAARAARPCADENGAGIAHAFAAQHDAAGLDLERRRHLVVARP